MFNSDNTTYTTEQFTLMLGDCLERMKEIERIVSSLTYRIKLQLVSGILSYHLNLCGLN